MSDQDVGDCACATPPGGPLRAFARELLDTLGRVGPADTDRVVSEFGIRAGEFMETSYRLRTGMRDAPLQPAEYLGLAVQILASSGADASALPPDGGSLRVVNRRCPFEDLGVCGPWLCDMACRIFEAIAVRNFGGGSVTVERGDGIHGRHCRFLIEITGGKRLQEEPQPWAVATGPASAPALPTPVGSEGGLGLVAESPAMRRVVQVVTTVAPSPATVLITGETGVGKELVARLLHALSDRRRAPFVAVNCGAIPETLIETALFGHERGAFTGALQQHQGFFERAGAGTLFLDEIDSLSLAAQSRLLRVLQEGEFERVGGRQVMRAPVRVVVATNRSLEEAVRTGRFRQDLYYRVHIVTVHIPPLRERPEDIAPLAEHLLARLGRKHERPPVRLGPRAAAQIAAYPWPGNVRELENALERSLLFTPGPMLEDILLTPADLFGPQEPVAMAEMSWKTYRDRMLREAEERYLEAAMRHCRGDVGAVARSMGLTRRAVYLKLQGCGMRAEQYRR